jgi:K(+)-stimulated pyrophosphate-energized sodium pump
MRLNTRALLPVFVTLIAAFGSMMLPAQARADESQIVLPDLHSQQFLGMDGHLLLTVGLAIPLLGIVFGLVIYGQLKRLPVHKSMHDVSDLIYETCKTYLLNQGKFIMMLWVCIAAVMVAYFGFLRAGHEDAVSVAALKAQGLEQYSKVVQVLSSWSSA